MKGEFAMRVALAAVLAVLTACSTPDRGPAVPEDLTATATIPGIPNARYTIGDEEGLRSYIAELGASFEREKAYRASVGETGPLPPANYLAISGGGDRGAYGAGLLVGWTAAGTRPAFKAVTGVSTGALTAPFAFLGPDYDDELKAVYTTISSDDVFVQRGLLNGLMSDAMADTSPLWALVSKYADDAMLQAVAAEYRKGRLLFVGTTNLDARRPVIWDMGAIAASGAPQALELFRTVLVASAAIPGAFPPVMIDVEVNGEPFQEMHVDGGASSQVFVYPPSLHVGEVTAAAGIERDRHLFIIRNARLDPEWAAVERQTMSIAGRAISSLIATQGVGDLYTIYVLTQRDGIDYNLAFIPASFDMTPEGQFDTAFMNALYEVGYQEAQSGMTWLHHPPDLAP